MQLVDVVAKERLPQLTLAVLTGITRICGNQGPNQGFERRKTLTTLK